MEVVVVVVVVLVVVALGGPLDSGTMAQINRVIFTFLSVSPGGLSSWVEVVVGEVVVVVDVVIFGSLGAKPNCTVFNAWRDVVAVPVVVVGSRKGGCCCGGCGGGCSTVDAVSSKCRTTVSCMAVKVGSTYCGSAKETVQTKVGNNDDDTLGARVKDKTASTSRADDMDRGLVVVVPTPMRPFQMPNSGTAAAGCLAAAAAG